MRRSFKYKVKMSASARRNAEWQLSRLCELYNAALEERQTAWRQARRSVSYYDQSAQMPGLKIDRPEYAAIGSQAILDCLRRLDRAFRAFYRRCQNGEAPGYPRFKSWRRYDSLTFRGPVPCGWRLDGRRLTMQGIGTAKLFLSRPIEGAIKTVTLRRDACGDWWVTFACENVPARPLPETGQSVGVDLGLTTFAALSDGSLIENPRPAITAEAKVRQAQRRVSKRRKGSNRRRVAVRRLAKHHRRVHRIRADFHWKLARALVERFDVVAVEGLNVKGLARGMLARAVNDAGWGDFLNRLACKAESAGREIVKVDPRGTSQACSGCGCEARKGLKVRTHDCPDCGLVLDRDVNAARNVLAIAQAGRAASRPGCKTAA